LKGKIKLITVQGIHQRGPHVHTQPSAVHLICISSITNTSEQYKNFHIISVT